MAQRSTPALATAIATATIPLRIRVAALPRDKRLMFERAAGELWDPKSSSLNPKALSPSSKTPSSAFKEGEYEDGFGLDREQVMLLEDLYALISSEQLRDQTEIPDDLVEPILKTLLLPKVTSFYTSLFE